MDDRFDRGTLTGRRVETVTYVFRKEGTVELPEIAIPWWDIDKKQIHQAVLPSLKLEIAPSMMAATGETDDLTAKGDARILPRWLWIVLLVMAGLLIMVVFYRGRILAWRAQRQQDRREREDLYFQQFAKAARSDDPKAAYNGVMRWLDRIHTGPGAARLDEFLRQYSDKQSLAEASRLEETLTKGSTGWNGNAFVETMKAARNNWRETQKAEEAVINLPPLNP